MAFLGDEDVVGAARGLHVHHLESDPRLRERRGEPRMREALARAGAEQHDLDTELLQNRKSSAVSASKRSTDQCSTRSASTTTLEERRSPFTIT